MLDVFLAGTHDLDRPLNMLGDLDGASDTVDLEPAAETAADQMIVRDNLVQGQTGGFRCGGLCPREGLGTDPDFATVIADMYSQFIGSMVACARNGT